jgi:hypothetical protein
MDFLRDSDTIAHLGSKSPGKRDWLPRWTIGRTFPELPLLPPEWQRKGSGRTEIAQEFLSRKTIFFLNRAQRLRHRAINPRCIVCPLGALRNAPIADVRGCSYGSATNLALVKIVQ